MGQKILHQGSTRHIKRSTINYAPKIKVAYFFLYISFILSASAQNFEEASVTGVASGNVTPNALYNATSPSIPSLAFIRATVTAGPANGNFRFISDNIQFETTSGGLATIKYEYLTATLTPIPASDIRLIINDLDGPNNETIETDCTNGVRFTATADPSNLIIDNVPPELSAAGTTGESGGTTSRVMYEYNDVTEVTFRVGAASAGWFKEFDMNFNNYTVGTPLYSVCGGDSDGDGVIDIDDLDDDNDGILDVTESGGNDPNGDADGDGLPNYLDTQYNTGDSPSYIGDGSITDYTDIDSDGQPDVYENSNDSDTLANHLDPDSDGDGCSDVIEAGYTDADGDGTVDGTGFNGDGTVAGSDGYGTPADIDPTNGIADYLEPAFTPLPNAGLDQSVFTTSTTLAGNTPSNGVGTWTILSGSGDVANANDPTSEITDLVQGQTILQWRFTESPCSATDDVILNVLILDIDGDGIDDIDDLDDDNDGIRDTEELCGDTATISTQTITVTIDLDQYEFATTWSLNSPSGNEVASGGPYAAGQDIINENIIALETGTYVFTIFDSAGTGMSSTGTGSNENGQAQYSLALEGTTIFASAINPNFGFSSAHNITGVVAEGDGFSCLNSDPMADNDIDGIINYQDADYASQNGSFINSAGVIASLDSDTDGLINSIDSNSDNDPCADAIEAGHTDPDNDNRLGTSPITIDPSSGLVTGQGGYTGTLPTVLVANGNLPDAGPDQAITSLSTSMTANIPVTATAMWTLINGSGTIVSSTSNTTSITNLGIGTTIFRWTFTDGACINFDDIVITVLNEIPAATNDNLTVEEDSLAGVLNQIDVSSNDAIGGNGGDGDDYALNSAPSNGSVTEVSDGVFEYIPNENFHGTDSFTYSITDADGDTATATVNIIINEVNDPPIAVADALSVTEGGTETSLDDGQTSVRANDTDAEDGTPTGNVTLVDDVSNGTLTLNADGTFSYVHDGSETTTDSFTYTVLDSTGELSNTVTVPITITPEAVGSTPIANNDTLTVVENSISGVPNQIVVSTNDAIGTDGGDTEDYALATLAINGVVAEISDGVFEYVPNMDFVGTDSFTYTITDADGDAATATVTITIEEDTDGDGIPNLQDPDDDNDGNPDTTDPNLLTPTASDDTVITKVGIETPVNVLSNDDFFAGIITSLTDLGTGTAGGTIIFDPATGKLIYTPAAGEEGTDVTVDYQVCNTAVSPLACATAKVTVTVEAVGSTPIANNDTLTVVENSISGVPNQIVVSTNDAIGTDGGDTEDYALATLAINGVVAEISDGVFEYVPNIDFVGTDSFTYTITDADGDAATATVTITIEEDTDGDGIPNLQDLDDDNDGILDTVEQQENPNLDTDNDGVINRLDLDSDGDGIPDLVESGSTGLDTDDNGQLDGPYGSDGIADSLQDVVDDGRVNYIPMDTDGNGILDFQDIDDDGDGVNTINEDIGSDGDPRNDDSDGDTIPDYLDQDDDGDGINTRYENPNPDNDNNPITGNTQDTDGDRVPDYLDQDDDGDGITTINENSNPDNDNDPATGDTQDSDNDSVPDYLDNDDDGDNTPTANEFPDPNGDGDPEDANDSNGDGDHDALVIRNIENFPENELNIYNRWGVLVYEAKGYGKDGKLFTGESNGRVTISQDKQLPVGTYFYILTYKNKNGELQKRSDYLYINR